MTQFSKIQMQYARKTNLYEFLLMHHADQFATEGVSLRPLWNHSISIHLGYSGYTDFSSGETGNSVDFLVKHMGYSVEQAVNCLCSNKTDQGTNLVVDQKLHQVAHDKKAVTVSEKILLPPKADVAYKQIFAYLQKRGIPSKTIQMLIQVGLLYQDKERNNAVFVNMTKDWAEIRGTHTDFSYHGIAKGSRVDGFWSFPSGTNICKSYVCESAIDAISLYLLHRKAGQHENAYYVSIGGASKQPAIERLARLGCVILAVDNDRAGTLCRVKNPQLHYILPSAKDWNEDWIRQIASI